MTTPFRTTRATLTALLLCVSLLAPASLRAQGGGKGGTQRKAVAAPAALAPQATFTNSAAINIPNPDSGPNPEPALLYPSPITVSGLSGTINLVTVTINGLHHSFPDDLDMLLVGPGGQTFHFWSDVGGGNCLGAVDSNGNPCANNGGANVNITVADSGTTTLPESTLLVNGTTYRPFNSAADANFPAPAPAGPYNEPTTVGTATFASVYNGLSGASLNGVWNLYVTDDLDGDVGGIAGGWTLNIGVAAPPTTAGQLIISEFRLRGAGGTEDEFIELYNTTGASLTTQAADASAGLAVAASDGTARCVVPNGTVIPAGGHFLCANSTAYSLGSYPAGNGTTATANATYTTGINDNVGIAIFNNSTGGASFSTANRLDAVGPTSEANTTYKEGTGYTAVAVASVDFSIYRKYDSVTGLPTDTGNNATDFQIVAVNANASLPTASLGAPGPENLSSPIERDATIKASLIAPCVASSAAPNRIRTGSGNSGSLSIRRRFTNNTGASVTRLRFRITDITTSPAPNGSTAILAATNSSTTTEAQPCPSGTVTINGLTLETPPAQALGGGFNSSLSAGTITLGTPLAAGASINVNFLLNISQAGSFRFFVNVEALP